MSVDTNHKLGKKIKGGGWVLGMMIITTNTDSTVPHFKLLKLWYKP